MAKYGLQASYGDAENGMPATTCRRTGRGGCPSGTVSGSDARPSRALAIASAPVGARHESTLRCAP